MQEPMETRTGAGETVKLTEKQVENLKIEYLLAAALQQNPAVFEFVRHLYDRLYAEIRTSASEPYDRTIMTDIHMDMHERLLRQRVFAHTDTSVFTEKKLHGSVGERSVLFFEHLNRKGPDYFDVIFTSITMAIFQYRYKGQTLVGKYEPKTLPAPFQETKQFRIASALKPLSARQMTLVPEEREIYADDLDQAYHSRGEDCYQLREGFHYADFAQDIHAPILTGLSYNAYAVFNVLATFLKFDVDDFRHLRYALIAYMVTGHDHTMIEVIDGINFILTHPEFKQRFQFDTSSLVVNISTAEAYQAVLDELSDFIKINAQKTESSGRLKGSHT